MKKLLALLLAMVMILGLAACGQKEEAPAATEAAPAATEAAPAATEAAAEAKPFEGVELTLWMVPMVDDATDSAFWTEQLAAFTEETGATVKIEIVPWAEMATKYTTAFMSNSAADVMYTTNEVLYDLINQGCLLDVSSYWSEEEIADENFWNSTAYNGKHYSVPFGGGMGYRGYLYNMDILEDCGITEDMLPTTWDELLTVLEAVKTNRPDVYAYLTPMIGNNNAFILNTQQYLYQSGGSLVNAEASAYTLDTPEMLEAMNFLKTLVDKGYMSTDALGLEWNAYLDLVIQGKVAIAPMNTPMSYFADSDFEWIFSTEMGNPDPAAFCPVDTIAVNAQTKNADAAVALLKFCRSYDVMKERVAQIHPGQGLVKKSYDFVKIVPEMEQACSNAQYAYALPIAPNQQVVIDAIVTNQQLVAMGDITPEEALKQIQAEADKAFG